MSRKKKCILICYEGETEDEFYSVVLDEIKAINNIDKFNVDKISKRCLQGITRFDKKLINKFANDINTIYKNYDVTIFLCYDTDVFELSAKPVIDWNNVEKELIRLGAKNVYHIRAEKCIEDVFLLDIGGICRYLNIKEVKRVSGNNGIEKMKTLFSKGNRVYQKGYSSSCFIQSLDIRKILSKEMTMFEPLINELLGPNE